MEKKRIEEIINDIVSAQLGECTVESENNFDGIGADSLDKMEMLLSAEDTFDIDIADEEILNWNTIRDIVNYIDKVKNG